MKKLLYTLFLLMGIAVCQKQANPTPQVLGSEPQRSARHQSTTETVPRRLSYQGLLTKPNGQAIKNGSYIVTFRFFTETEGGLAFWEESQTVDVKDGIISTILGDSTEITKFPVETYLEIDIEGTTLSPRQEMTSVFYSVKSDTAKYAQGGNYYDLDDLPNLSNVAMSGDYDDLSNKPDLTAYATNDTLSGYVLSSTLSTVATTGDYNDLENQPDLSNVATNDTLGSYALTSDLATVATTGDYNDL
ncbi:uncharacterized protein METZ01_LOCUS250591, partial [marine metagenome]